MTDFSPQLVITNIGSTLSLIVIMALGFYIFFKGPRRPTNIIFLLLSLAIAAYQSAHLIGINRLDAVASRAAFMYTLVFLFIPVFTLHWVYATLGELRKHMPGIFSSYAVAVLLVLFFLKFPAAYTAHSVPKLYFPNFLSPGPLLWLPLVFSFFLVCISAVVLLRSYVRSEGAMRNRLKYFLVTVFLGYFLGSLPIFLIYDVPVNPLPAVFMGFYVIPLAYGILKYELMDIEIVARRALGFTAAVVGVGLLIIAINLLNASLQRNIPGFPSWILPIASAVFVVVGARIVWNQIRALDRLKYEFITVVTHKFRTPLTSIKWFAENLALADDQADRQKAVDAILNANMRLEELTDSLVGLSKTEMSVSDYSFAPEALQALLGESVNGIRQRAHEKNIHLVVNLDAGVPLMIVDRRKCKLLLQILLENALQYTPSGGTVAVSLAHSAGGGVDIRISDSGIGIPEEELSHVFEKFFRGVLAKRVDTEGIGTSLYLAKGIAKRHHADLVVASDGEGKGSTFILRFKTARTS